MIDQPPLPFAPARDLTEAPFLESACNADALAFLRAPWPGGALALIGPEGSGKTHLATQWAARPQVQVIEDADLHPDAEDLFHALNAAQAGGTALLLTSRLRPAAWPAALPDLRSRLNALPVAELHEPDDVLLAQVLRALFRDRFITPAPDLIPYLLTRMDRSFAAARAIVERLHAAGLSQGRGVNRALAARELEVASVINDLFDDGR